MWDPGRWGWTLRNRRTDTNVDLRYLVGQVKVYVSHNHNFARDLCQALPFCPKLHNCCKHLIQSNNSWWNIWTQLESVTRQQVMWWTGRSEFPIKQCGVSGKRGHIGHLLLEAWWLLLSRWPLSRTPPTGYWSDLSVHLASSRLWLPWCRFGRASHCTGRSSPGHSEHAPS